MPLEPLTLTVTRTGTDAQLRVRAGHAILEGSITIDALDQLATLFQAEALELRRARHRLATPTHYETLGVSRDANADDIRDAYRAAAKRQHPDLSGRETGAAMQAINDAYAVLGDPQQRHQYDEQFIH